MSKNQVQQSNKPLLWKALNIKTQRTVDKDTNFLKLSKRLKDKGISRKDIIFTPELGKGIWIL